MTTPKIKVAEKYEMHNGLLDRRCTDAVRDEVRLCCCAPLGSLRAVQTPTGSKCMDFRNELILEYHNSVHGGHRGRDATIEVIRASWFWPSLVEDVWNWCKSCTRCQEESGHTAHQAWTRTTLYSRPFRAIQMDTVEVPHVNGFTCLLTVIDLFSRWVWIIPLMDKTGETIGEALLSRVFAPFNCWPVVLRSDNAASFVGTAVQYINKKLEIAHLTGATYHPQAQGSVERMHRKINELIRRMLNEPDDNLQGDWTIWIPFVEGHIRTQKMKALGGRSPMEVVMGIQPELPATLRAGLNVQDMNTTDYMHDLVKYLKETHKRVRALAAELEIEKEGRDDGAPGARGLAVGDLVALKKGKKPHGTSRFGRSCDGNIYRIRDVLG